MSILTGRPLGAFLNPVATVAAIAPQLWKPTDEPSLKVWLDGNDSSAFTLNGSNRILQWLDKSGNGYHFAPPSPETAPLRTATGCYFDDRLQQLNIASRFGLGANPDLTVIAVLDTTNSSALSRDFFRIGAAAAGGLAVMASPASWRWRYFNGAKTFSIPDYKGVQLISAVRPLNGTFDQADLYLNGAPAAVEAAGSSNTPSRTEAEAQLSGDLILQVKALMVFESSSVALRQRAEGYAYSKYSLDRTLVSGHPYENAAP